MKLVAIILSLTAFTQNVDAQIEKGKILLGGSSNLGFTSSSTSAGGASTGQLDADLSIGYLITNGFVAGADVRFTMTKNDGSSSEFGGGLFLRYYIKNFYPELKVGLTSSSGDNSDTFKTTYFGGGIGYAIMLGDMVSIDPKVSYILNTYDGGDSTNFGFRLGINIYL